MTFTYVPGGMGVACGGTRKFDGAAAASARNPARLLTSALTHCVATRGGPVMSSTWYWTLVSRWADLLTTPTTDTCVRRKPTEQIPKRHRRVNPSGIHKILLLRRHRQVPSPRWPR